MIVSLEGKLVQADVLSVVIEVSGIGYLVNVPLSVTSAMPKIGSNIKLFIYPVYREDRHDLFGFNTQEDRDFFKLVVEKVSGIGPKTALNILSKLSLATIKQAIANKNHEILAHCHGVGKKSAERIVMELSDKSISSTQSFISHISNPSSVSNISDAVSALVSLGYKAADAEKAVQKSIERVGESATTENIIRTALGA